jgi:hypothetical protein
MAQPPPPPFALEVSPEATLQFLLTRGETDGESAAKTTMTLRHTGQTSEAVAFKVRDDIWQGERFGS